MLFCFILRCMAITHAYERRYEKGDGHNGHHHKERIKENFFRCHLSNFVGEWTLLQSIKKGNVITEEPKISTLSFLES